MNNEFQIEIAHGRTRLALASAGLSDVTLATAELEVSGLDRVFE
jgi:hypothetical protein